MSEKRFIVETVEITDCKTDKSRIAKVITDTHELCSCEDLYELCDELNNLAEENEQLKKRLEHYKEVEAMNEEQETIVIKLTPKYWGYEAEVVVDDDN